ncbi:centrosome-associated protein 350-like [Uloborus diversus]|uniref:centrosome-associated protein 350-like n=1 Tax=Uloborus diversus TaxID=327109 RepID=UPI002408FD1D|nr:centrosome-associated protein 350-like [Uloborus diversus]
MAKVGNHVEIAERKLLNAKRSMSSRKGSSLSLLSSKPSHIELKSVNKTKHFERHFIKGTLLEKPKLKSYPIQNESIPHIDKVVSSTAAEAKPKPPPFKIPEIEPKELKQVLSQSSTPLTVSTSDTSNFPELQYSSSGSTSSLIMGLSENKDLKYAMTRHKTKSNDNAPKIVFSSWEKIFLQEEEVGLDSQISSPASENVPPARKVTNGMEWKIVPAGKKPIFNRNSSKSNSGFQKLRDIIERQKKKFEASNIESDDDVVVNHRKFLKSSPTHEHKKLPEKPTYGETLQVESATSLWKESDQVVVVKKPAIKQKSSNREECDAVKSTSEKSSKSSSSELSSQETVSNHMNHSTKENVESHPAVESDVSESIGEKTKITEQVKSFDEDISELTSIVDTKQSSKADNVLPSKTPKSIKRKAVKPPEQSAPSPKVRHYDVEKVRDYIQKKRIERKKRHMEEHKKRLMEVQKKEEGLQKLYEHQKQSVKAVSKDNPMSPLKVSKSKKLAVLKMHHNNSPAVLNKENFQKLTSKLGHGGNVLENKECSESASARVKQNVPPEESEEPTRDFMPMKTDLKVCKPNKIHDSHEIKENDSFPKVSDQALISIAKAGDKDVPSKMVNLNESSKPDILASSSNCSYASTLSTPTELSQMSGISKSFLQALKEAKAAPPITSESRQCETLKNLMKSIDVLIEPYEYFLRTKKWVEESPPPPSLKDSEKTESSAGNIINKAVHKKNSRNFKLEIAKSLSMPKDNSIFMERVSGIGDPNELYSRIMNEDASIQSVVENNIKQTSKSVESDENVSEDDLIEESLPSDEENEVISATNLNEIHSPHVSPSLSHHNSGASEALISHSISSDESKENSVVELQRKKNMSSASNSESLVSDVISIVENTNGRSPNSDETLINESKSINSQEDASSGPVASKISDTVEENGSNVETDESIRSVMESSGSEIGSDKNSTRNSSFIGDSHRIKESQDEISVKSKSDRMNIKSISANGSNGVALNSKHDLSGYAPGGAAKKGMTNIQENTKHFTQFPDDGGMSDDEFLGDSMGVSLVYIRTFSCPHEKIQGRKDLIKQHIPSENEQYLHSQFVKKVASEAAAAAAKSAVTEILKSQKSISSKRHPIRISVVDSSSSSMRSKQHSINSEYVGFEKSSSKQSKSSRKKSKHSTSNASSKHDEIIEEIQSASNEEIMEQSSSIELEELSAQKSSHSSSSKVAEVIESVTSDLNASSISEKFSERSNKRKISGNLSSPSPASLSDNESISSATMISSQSGDSDFSHQNESDDSFAQLALDVVKGMSHDKQLSAKEKLSFLQMQEKIIVEKARVEIKLLELCKKKLRDKGKEREVTAIKKLQNEIILRLRQEKAELQCRQEACRSICENHKALLEDKKKLLKEPMSLAYQILNRKEKGHISKLASQDKLKEVPRAKSSSSSTPTVISNDEQIVEEEGVISEVPEMLKGLASNSSLESVIEQIPEQTKSSLPSYSKSHQSSPSVTYSPSNTGQSNSNMNQPSNSLDTNIQGLKKLEASKRHLTKREQRILQRRKHVESLLQWHKKLDSEEMAVRELEQKALELVDHSKKKTKYYVSSTSTELNNMNKTEPNTETAPPPEAKVNFSSQSSDITSSIKNASSSHKLSNKESSSILEESNSGSSSGNGVEEALTPEKGSSGAESYVTTVASSLKEDIKSGSSATSVHTVDAPAENSVGEEIIGDEVSSIVISPSLKDRSSNSDIYSESFESTTSRKSILLSSPLSFRNTSPKQSLKKDSGLGIRAPLVPRNMRRHDSSGSDDSYTISHSETASDQSDIEVRIHALAEELRRRKAEAEKLKREQKKKYREQLKEKELSLQKQIEAYNQYIQQTKHQIESAVSLPQTSNTTVVKPQIKWPRPEKILESRRLRKQTPYVHDTFSEKKSAEINGSSPESAKSFTERSPESRTRSEVKTSALPLSVQELSTIKTISNSFVNNISAEIKELSSKGDQSKDSAGEISSLEVETSEIISDHSSRSQAQSNDSTHSSLEKSVEEIADKYEKSSNNVTESKSDTFISETASPSNHTSNGKHTDDSLSHKSSSAGEEGNYSEEFVDDHDSDQSHDSNRTVLNESTGSSEMESSSEAHSVVNTGSVDEEVDAENFKCDTSSGCPAPHSDAFVKKLIVPDKKSVPQDAIESSILQVPFSNSKSSSSSKKTLKIKPNSELFIVNVANYMCSSILDEAIKTIIFLKRKKSNSNHLKSSNSYNILETVVKKSYVPVQNKDKTVLAIVNHLMEKYLTNSVSSIVKTYQTFKSKSLQANNENKYAVFEDAENTGSKLEVDLSLQTTHFPSLVDNYDQVTIQYPQTLQDLNDNSIFNKSVNWLDGAFLSSTNEFQVQQLEQQLLLQQQYSFYYRKIPNKPPPPYTPPSTGVSTISLVRETHVAKVQDIKSITENISYVLDHIVDVVLDGKKQGLSINEILAPKFESIAERFELVDPSQVIFIDLIFDVTKEILLEQFSETDPEPQPWLRTRKLTPKPAFPVDKNRLMKVLEKEVQLALKLTSESTKMSRRKQTLWSAMKLGRKKRDFVDTILIKELKEEEPEWVNYDQDEVTVKFQIADYILNLLVDDTLKVFQNLQHKCHQ